MRNIEECIAYIAKELNKAAESHKQAYIRKDKVQLPNLHKKKQILETILEILKQNGQQN